MNRQIIDREYLYIVRDILEHQEFQRLSSITHHGNNRYDHCVRVSFWSYRISKFFRLDYGRVARAALLHDFFFEENEGIDKKTRTTVLVKHPQYALENACRYFELSDMEKDIIATHMFPVNLRVPKYLESWIVDLVDDVVAVYEKTYILRKQLSTSVSFMFIILLNYLR